MRKRVLRRATMSAVALLLALSAVAYADVINADGDRVQDSAQTMIELGTVGAGATITYDVYFLLECRLTGAHAVPGSTISLTPRVMAFAPGGTITATPATIGPIPANWPAAGQPCTGDPVYQSTTPSVVTIVAPMVADTGYTYRLDYLKAPLTGIVGASTMTFRLNVSTNTAPVVSPLVDQIAEGNTLGGWLASYGATATDAEDGPLAAPCVPAPGSILPVGQTIVVCTATDSAGATGSRSFRMNVTDTTRPILSDVPSGAAGETPDAAGANISWSAPSAVDIVDGTLNVTCAPASGSLFAVGSTTVECSASDTSGNSATGSFNVDVTLVDTTPPVLSNVPGDIAVDTPDPAGADVTWPDPSAVDNIDGLVPVTCAPASGSHFAVGSTTVQCSASDAHGNVAMSIFSVDVTLVDTTPPVLTGIPGDIDASTTSPTGAVVTWRGPTAADNLDGPLLVSCAPASGSRFAVGSTTVRCSATDAHGNVASASFTVRVTLLDTTPPVLTGVPTNISVVENPAARMTITWPDPSAVDNIDGPVPVTCTPASGSAFPVGTTTVTCSASDSAGNVASARFSVTVTAAPAPDPTPVPAPDPTPVPAPDPTPVPAPDPTPVPAPDPTPVPDPELDPDLTVAWAEPVSDSVPLKARIGNSVPLKAKITIDGATLRPAAGTPRLVLERLTACGGEVVERLDGEAFRYKEKSWKLNLDTSKLGAGCWRVSVAVGEYQGGAFELMLRGRDGRSRDRDRDRHSDERESDEQGD